MPTLVQIQLGPYSQKRRFLPLFRPCGSVVEHTLGKGEVTSSILVTGFCKSNKAATRSNTLEDKVLAKNQPSAVPGYAQIAARACKDLVEEGEL